MQSQLFVCYRILSKYGMVILEWTWTSYISLWSSVALWHWRSKSTVIQVPRWHQAIIWTTADFFIGTTLSDIGIKIQQTSFMKMPSAKRFRPQCVNLYWYIVAQWYNDTWWSSPYLVAIAAFNQLNGTPLTKLMLIWCHMDLYLQWNFNQNTQKMKKTQLSHFLELEFWKMLFLTNGHVSCWNNAKLQFESSLNITQSNTCNIIHI